MKSVLITLVSCLIAFKSMALGWGQSCYFTCTAAMAAKETPGILEASGALDEAGIFYDCAKSCKFNAAPNMWYTFLAHSIYHTARKEIEARVKEKLKKDGAANSAVFTNLIPVLPVNVSYADFIDNLSIELAKKIPANGVDTITNRKSSFLGGELLLGVHTEQFRKIARQQKFITDYLNNKSETNKKAGEFLLEELENQFKDALSRLEKNADKEFGKNLNINEDKEIVEDFRSQSKRELKMGKPSDVSGGFFTSLIPSGLKWTCDNSCRTFQQGQKAGKDFTKAVLHDGKKAEDTRFYWCQQNCPAEKYNKFYCGAFDNVGRDETNFKKSNKDAIGMLNETKNYTYLRRRKPPLVEQCLNYFLEYGKGETADNTGDIYKLSMSNIFYTAKAFDEASVGEKGKKPAEEEDGYEEDGYEDDDYYEGLDDEDLDDDEIEALIKEHSK